MTYENEGTEQISLRKSLGRESCSLAELATRQIREAVMTGEFVPGQRLKEEELCRMFDISRLPIREAFKTLVANGILLHKPRKGVFVAQFTAEDVKEVYTLIAMLYQKTTDMAMDVMTDHDVEQLKECVDMMLASVSEDRCDIRSYQMAHDKFHQVLIDLAGNGRIKELEKQLRDQIFLFSYTSFQERTHLKSSLDFHMRIYTAIREGHKLQAVDLMEEHVNKAIVFLVKQLS